MPETQDSIKEENWGLHKHDARLRKEGKCHNANSLIAKYA